MIQKKAFGFISFKRPFKIIYKFSLLACFAKTTFEVADNPALYQCLFCLRGKKLLQFYQRVY